MRLAMLAVLFLIAAPTLAVAQASQFEGAIRASAALQLAARPVTDSPTPSYLAADALALRRQSKNKSTGVTLMLIGGGAILVGALAGGGGGTVLIVGGAVCAGYGFYLYTE